MTQPSLPLESAAPVRIEWSGKLSELLPVLTAEARVAGDGAWRFRQLKHGALVAVQLGTDRRRVLRIARADRPANALASQRWEVELQTFERHLGVGGWQRSDDPDTAGVAVRYLELWEGEVAPWKAACMDCKAEIPYDKVFGGRDRCQQCAIIAGRSGT